MEPPNRPLYAICVGNLKEYMEPPNHPLYTQLGVGVVVESRRKAVQLRMEPPNRPLYAVVSF